MSSPATPKAAVKQVERPDATTASHETPARGVLPVLSMAAGALVIVGALTFLLVEREPEIDIPDFSSAFACPPGVESRSGRMNVTANELNVRAAPNAKADRLPDRTLRKHTSVTEECRSGSWSRVRLVDGRWGWVANQYLASISLTN
jgi:hypothetical protein